MTESHHGCIEVALWKNMIADRNANMLPSKNRGILISDLDNTLLRTDMLHETFWSAFSREEFRANGGKTALVSASNQDLVQEIAAYTNIFDEAHGTNIRLNLKGKNKAIFLTDMYGEKSFTYIVSERIYGIH